MTIFLFSIFVLSACSNDTNVKDVSVGEAESMIEEESVQILDVRTPEEFEDMSLDDSVLIPVQVLEDRIDELDPEESYLVVCRTGNRSAEASDILVEQGFNDVRNLDGGVIDLN